MQAMYRWGPYRPGSGRFCGGYPQEGVIQQGRYPGNNGHIGEVKHVPIVGISTDIEVEQGEIDHRAMQEAVDAVADRTADDQAEPEDDPGRDADADAPGVVDVVGRLGQEEHRRDAAARLG